MKEVAKILQLVLSEKLGQTQSQNLNDEFWNQATNLFLSYDSHPQRTIDFIKNNFTENKFTKEAVHSFYERFIDELSENFVQNPDLFEDDKTELVGNDQFCKKVNYFKTLELAIRDSERNRIKNEFDLMYERLDFEVEDREFEKSIQIHSRKELKKKFQDWDDELSKESKLGDIAAAPKAKSKFLWKGLAVAASLFLIAGLLIIYNNQKPKNLFSDQPIVKTNKTDKEKNRTETGNGVETQNGNENISTNDLQDLNDIKLAKIDVRSEKGELLYPNSLGFSGKEEKEIDIIFISSSDRKKDLEKYIDDFWEENNGRPLSLGPKYQEIEVELEQWKNKKGKYIFNGENLILYDSDFSLNNLLFLSSDDKFYVYNKENKTFYHLIKTEAKIEFNNPGQKVNSFEKVSDQEIIEKLEKILFENDVE